MPPHVLAIDLGTGGPKVGLVSMDGKIAGHEFEPTPVILGARGAVEQDPEGWWEAVVAASRRLMARDLVAQLDIAAVSVTGQWATTVPVGENGNALMGALSWMDGRGARHTRRVAGGPIRIAGYGPLKIARWVRLTGGAPGLSGRDPVGHMLFIKHERPDVYERTRAFLEPVDFLNLKLTGRIVTAAETATLHWATDTRDLARIAYDERLVRLTSLDAAKFPEIVPTGSVVGPLTPDAASELGLGGEVPVVTGTPDTMSAAVGSGAVADYAAHLYVGTSGWLSCHVPFKRTDPRRSIASLPSSVPGRYLVSTEQQVAGAALSHLRDKLLGAGNTSYEELLDDAAAEPPGSGGVLFTPWLNGERTPLEDPHIRAAYFNLSLDTTRARLVRATLEGVALNTRWMHRAVERFVRRELDDIAFIGGGARSPLWCQILADTLDRTVRQVGEPIHANLRGAAFLAGAALGRLDLADVPDLVPITATYAPDPRRARLYDELFGEFRRLYKATRPLYRRLNPTPTEEN